MNLVSLVGHVIELLTGLEGSSEPADRYVSGFLRKRSYIGSRDRKFISEAVYGIIRHRRHLEALLEEYIVKHQSANELDVPVKRFLPLYVMHSLTHPAQSLSDNSSVPVSFWKTYFSTIELDEFVRWIEQHRTLDFLSSDPIVRRGVQYSFQDWMVRSFVDRFGIETEPLLSALNEPARVALRVNVSKTSREECAKRLRDEGIQTEPTPFSPVGLFAEKRFNTRSSPSFIEGCYEVQDEGSQIVSLIAQPTPGDVVIDGCAGAGGKSLHLADMMQNDGEIIAIDTDERRLIELARRSERAGSRILHTLLHEEMVPENFFRKANIVLVDAPCSGVGTIRRNPIFKWRITESLVKHYAEMQRSILEFNSRFVKPGGTLVYATCSLFRQENEDIVEEFLSSHPTFIPVPKNERLQELGLEPQGPFITLTPHKHRTDGFFIAVLEHHP